MYLWHRIYFNFGIQILKTSIDRAFFQVSKLWNTTSVLEISTCLLTNANEQTRQGWFLVLAHLSSAVSKKYFIFLTFSMK